MKHEILSENLPCCDFVSDCSFGDIVLFLQK